MKNVVWYALVMTISVVGLAITARSSEIHERTLNSDLVPSPVHYAVVLPDGYDDATDRFPLVLLLHGGKSSHKELFWWKGILDQLWAEGSISKAVVAMPSTGTTTLEGRSEYMDFHDGSQRWYSFVMGPFLRHIRQEYHVSSDSASTVIGGISMGGLGALRFALKHPGEFAGVAAWEPSILPAFHWKDVKPRNRFHYADEFLESIFGKPFPANWEANNPAMIVTTQADAIRNSGIQIYLECGDQDYLNLHEGTEFLHRVFWDHGIPHEYHSVRGADHLGRTLPRRIREGVQFLDRALHPLGDDRDPALLDMIEVFRELKTKAEQESADDAPTEP